MDDKRLGVSVLGELEVSVDGCAVDVGGPQNRVLVAGLAVDANKVVATDDLARLIWGSSPVDASIRVAKAVYRLRAALPEDARDVIGTSPAGYILHLDPSRYDATRFTGLLRAAQDDLRSAANRPALEKLDAALELWRGDAFADVGGRETLKVEGDRLDELRLVAIEDRLEAKVRLRQHKEAIEELQIGRASCRERV